MPQEKDRIFLECFVSPLTANDVIKGKTYAARYDIEQNLQTIPNMIKDQENVYVNRIKRYFNKDAWSEILRLIEAKAKQPYFCTVCDGCCDSATSAFSCLRCLRKTHSTCVFTKGSQKKRVNYVCASCKVKYCN